MLHAPQIHLKYCLCLAQALTGLLDGAGLYEVCGAQQLQARSRLAVARQQLRWQEDLPVE